MSEFRVGDRVKRVSNIVSAPELSKEVIYTVLKLHEPSGIYLKEINNDFSYTAEYFELVAREKHPEEEFLNAMKNSNRLIEI